MAATPVSERPTLFDEGLNFRRFGHFTRPLAPGDVRVRAHPAGASWIELDALSRRLRDGDFSAARSVLALLRRSQDWRVKSAAACLLGYTGSPDEFREMRAELDDSPHHAAESIDAATREWLLVYCQAFARWHRLDVVPFLLDQYVFLRRKRTAEISLLPRLIAGLVAEPGEMIAHEPPDDRLTDYVALVMDRYEDVVAHVGSESAYVHRGSLLTVTGLAERLVSPNIRYPSVELAALREPFESLTGIDLSDAFPEGRASVSAAATLVERLVDAGRLAGFEPGVRYFFGRAVSTRAAVAE